VAALLLLRGRQGDSDDPYGGGYSPGAYPGYAERSRMTARVTAQVPLPGQTGRQPTPGRFGRSGVQEMPGGFDDRPTGGVAQWEEHEPGPGPDWQPRPMSGHPRESSPPGSGGLEPSGGGYTPADPWAEAEAMFGPRPPMRPRDPRGGNSATNSANQDNGW